MLDDVDINAPVSTKCEDWTYSGDQLSNRSAQPVVENVDNGSKVDFSLETH